MGAARINLETLSDDERSIIEARREYKRKWRAANKERVKEYDRRFWAKKAAEQAKFNEQE
ncbi:MAG: phosphatase [Oscillospiraceae bacterium]